ncbi:MAG: ketopantoate reductase family protein [Promethearchaeota archaeon]|nr:MAG: ketopantoate reductase family protein [Candidatus Lokiarchaeota archaeon]
MVDKFKIGIIGIGPTGGILAAHLAKMGHNVVLVDINKTHMDKIKKKGLTLTNLKTFNVKFPKENICYSINELENKSINTLFIAVKASHLEEILPKIKKIVKPGTTLISAQNGFDTEELIAEFVGEENTIRLVINYAGNIIEDGIIRMSFFNPPNYLGVLTTKAEEKARKLAEIINSSGLETIFTPDIKKYEWTKCILNTISPVCVTTHTTMKQTMGFEDTRKICREILREGIEVARARGLNFEPDFLEKCMNYLDKAGHHRVSMEADINAGNPSEIGFLNGKIVEYGELEGIPTPYNKIFVSLIKGCELPPVNRD